MALTNRKKKDRPTVETPVSESRFDDSKEIRDGKNGNNLQVAENSSKNYSKLATDVTTIDFDTQYSAKDRKTIKADPDIKSLIEIFSDFEGTKAYETLRQMTQYYYENNYDERAQRIIASIQNNKFLG
ncbi:hypothetical protein ADIAL_0106 [Alkalibacterium sp. AK22]|uniref:hypothetical protein n=1 Tax=Alkalibacterium sp. AK22 TaxID=1229520 RepID=UPI00044C2E06|nr:hypothetical protein [Alkalibacterium sp. AK22]EXJ24367.1 hypothetical protein ADIAL_0106 [Alkalibacterium sp. AK22]